MAYYSADKRNELLTYTASCVNLQRVIISEIIVSLKGYVLYAFICRAFFK